MKFKELFTIFEDDFLLQIDIHLIGTKTFIACFLLVNYRRGRMAQKKESNLGYKIGCCE